MPEGYITNEIPLNYHSISPHSVFTLITKYPCLCERESNRQTGTEDRDAETILDLIHLNSERFHFEREAFTDLTQPQCLIPDPSHNSCVSELRSDGLVPLGTVSLL